MKQKSIIIALAKGIIQLKKINRDCVITFFRTKAVTGATNARAVLTINQSILPLLKFTNHYSMHLVKKEKKSRIAHEAWSDTGLSIGGDRLLTPYRNKRVEESHAAHESLVPALSD